MAHLNFTPSSRLSLALCAGLLSGSASGWAQSAPDYEQPPVSYSASTPADAVTVLQQRIDQGALSFAGNEKELLRAFLGAVNVPVESQLLVFSKTSLQRGLIRPENPRALYFSDSIFVGWVPGGLIEVVAIDPQLGPVFYSLDLRHGKAAAPQIVRDADCLRCHGGTFVRDIPGVFSRSVFADASGELLLRYGTQVVDDETPFTERWGGWYVTGYHGSEPHRGNVLSAEKGDQLIFTPSNDRPDDLSGLLNIERYLSTGSDVVALLVFEHQTTMQNALTHAGLSSRRMLAYQKSLQEAFKEPITDVPTYDSVKSVFASVSQEIIDRLLFRNAAPVPAGVNGNAAFRQHFTAKGPHDSAGRSLREFDLHNRLFASRCSYLIYSESFLALPDPLKSLVFSRLQTALRDRDPKGRYAYLGADEKERIYTLLKETHPEAARSWAASESN